MRRPPYSLKLAPNPLILASTDALCDHLSHPGTAAQGGPEAAAAAGEGGTVPGSTGDVRVVRAEVAQAGCASR